MSGAAVTVRQQLAEFFSRNVLPAVYPDQDVAVVAIDYMNYTPGEECVILYSLRSGVRPADPVRSAMVTFAEDRRLEEVYIRHYGGGAGPPTESVAPPAVFLPEYRCLVEFFPWDWKLPSLFRATEPEEMARL